MISICIKIILEGILYYWVIVRKAIKSLPDLPKIIVLKPMKNITRIVFLFVLLNAVVYSTAQAQIIINNGGGRIQIVNNNGIVQNGNGPENNLIQAPRETIQRLKTALVLMDEKRYSESVRMHLHLDFATHTQS